MHARPIMVWVLLGALTAAIGTALWRQRMGVEALRVELMAQRALLADAATVRSEHARLKAQQISSEELERLRADRAALERLRAEVDRVKVSSQLPARLKNALVPKSPNLPPPPEMIPASAWKNAGRTTPRAALETMLWAAVAGDMDVLVETLALEPAAQEKAAALLRTLPPALRGRYDSPERLIAEFTANDVPADGRMRVIVQSGGTGDDARLLVSVHAAKAPPATHFALRRHSDGWKLVVPVSAVDKYAAVLAAK